ncbi:MAG TPA: bifunctional lytic transglycosylase/C40 family peptidase [Streptosporangiaceae bacterium]|jgi:peptidoglycan DL-endopeptidase CwlO
MGMISIPLMVVGGTSMMFAAGGGNKCPTGQTGTATTSQVSPRGKASIPANYLTIYQQTGQKYGVPWPILAGIGEVESDHGRSNLPGVHSASNAFGAAGPMQIGIGGAAGNVWGGAPVHPASERVNGVATDGNGDGIASVYEPADAVAGAAKYLLRNGVQGNVRGAIFAYNHLLSYVQAVLSWASTYAKGGYTIGPVTVAQQCSTLVSTAVPNHVVSVAIAYAKAQIGKPYLWGGTGPDAFDCSGLVMMAYRQAGVNIPRTSEEQWAWGPKIQPGHEEPGDLVFFAGSDGTQTNPGHVALVIGKGKMIEAYATGFPIRISSFGTSNSAPGDQSVVGFTRPWAHAGVVLSGQGLTG